MANFTAVPTDPTKSPQKLDTWEKRTEWPLAAIALIFLAAYAVDVLPSQKMRPPWPSISSRGFRG
jgi:hypothetical protein